MRKEEGYLRKLLSLTLICCMMFLIATAHVSAKEHIVGDAAAGVNEFDLAGNSAQFHVTIMDRAHRYAVDLEYSSLTVSFVGGLTWDVNELAYIYDGDPDEDKAPKEVTMTVINHSDLPILIEPTLTPKTDVEMTHTFSTGQNFIPGLQHGDEAKTNTMTITVKPNTTWSAVAAAVDESTVELGTVTITIKEMD